MRSKLIVTLAVAAFITPSLAWAHGDHRHAKPGHGHWKHAHRHPRHERVVVHEIVRPVLVYPRVAYSEPPAPAPGIQIIFPDITIPFP